MDPEEHAGEQVTLPAESDIKRWNGSNFRLAQQTKVRIVGIDPLEPEHVLVLAEQSGLLEGVDEEGLLWQLNEDDKLYVIPFLLGLLLTELPRLEATVRGRVSGLAERALN